MVALLFLYDTSFIVDFREKHVFATDFRGKHITDHRARVCARAILRFRMRWRAPSKNFNKVQTTMNSEIQ